MTVVKVNSVLRNFYRELNYKVPLRIFMSICLITFIGCRDAEEKVEETEDVQTEETNSDEEDKIAALQENNVNIGLFVDAEELFKYQPSDTQRINDYTEFEAPSGRRLGETCPKKDFTVGVNRASTVIWRISQINPPNNQYDVELVFVKYKEEEGSYNFFDKDTLTPGTNGAKNIIRDKITRGWAGNYYDYDIKFKITNQSEDTHKEYSIDPKLRMYVETLLKDLN